VRGWPAPPLGPPLLPLTHTDVGARGRYNDQLEAELCKEVENGRLVRLTAKLGFINERPEYVCVRLCVCVCVCVSVPVYARVARPPLRLYAGCRVPPPPPPSFPTSLC
jgi:hypothetical protein